jgi:hypothetical protein
MRDISANLPESKARHRAWHQDRVSPAAVERVMIWIDDCEKKHPGCRKTHSSTLPTRVLDVCPEESSKDMCLVLGLEREADYVTLSHCWGTDLSNESDL